MASRAVAKKKPGAKKPAAKKSPVKKSIAKKSATGKKAPVTKKTAAKKVTTKKTAVKKSTAKKTTAKKVAVKKSATKKAGTKAVPVKKAVRAKSSKQAKRVVEEVVDYKNKIQLDLGFIGSKDESAEARNVASRERVRSKMDGDVEAFLKSGGKINTIAPNVMADPPRKPESNYGSRPI